MKVMVLGATGMAGHVVNRYLREQGHEMVPHRGREHIDLSKGFEELEAWVEEVEPDVIVNCVGILVKPSEDNPELAEKINGELPHALAKMGPRLLHLSTDCVFSGEHGVYTEKSVPDEKKVYGRTKAMGEVDSYPHCTVRVSIIGPEIGEGTGLFAWAKSEAGNEVNGYTNAFWNGITTLELAKFIDRFVRGEKGIHGLLHLRSGGVVSKYQLLQYISESHNLKLKVHAHELEESVDKSLLSLRRDFEYEPLPIHVQLKQLREWYLD